MSLIVRYSLSPVNLSTERVGEIDRNLESHGNQQEFAFIIDWTYEKNIYNLRIDPFKELSVRDYDYQNPNSLLVASREDIPKSRVQLLAQTSLTVIEAMELFDNIDSASDLDFIYKSIRILEPNIEKIFPIDKNSRKDNCRGSFYVQISDSDKRIPIGSMGDGVWRMLGLSLALVAAKDGVLLVDEIDTGLHYTALEDMWKLIWETAKKLNVQVFATTHSRDCWESMEVLAHRDDVEEEDISIQRIEKDTPRSVVFNKKGIATAAKREIEVR